MRIPTLDYVHFDPCALLESCPKADLSSLLASRLYIVKRSSYYELIPMHSMDDGHTGYLGDMLSLFSYSLLEGPEANKAYRSLIVNCWFPLVLLVVVIWACKLTR